MLPVCCSRNCLHVARTAQTASTLFRFSWTFHPLICRMLRYIIPNPPVQDQNWPHFALGRCVRGFAHTAKTYYGCSSEQAMPGITSDSGNGHPHIAGSEPCSQLAFADMTTLRLVKASLPVVPTIQDLQIFWPVSKLQDRSWLSQRHQKALRGSRYSNFCKHTSLPSKFKAQVSLMVSY